MSLFTFEINFKILLRPLMIGFTEIFPVVTYHAKPANHCFIILIFTCIIIRQYSLVGIMHAIFTDHLLEILQALCAYCTNDIDVNANQLCNLMYRTMAESDYLESIAIDVRLLVRGKTRQSMGT